MSNVDPFPSFSYVANYEALILPVYPYIQRITRSDPTFGYTQNRMYDVLERRCDTLKSQISVLVDIHVQMPGIFENTLSFDNAQNSMLGGWVLNATSNLQYTLNTVGDPATYEGTLGTGCLVRLSDVETASTQVQYFTATNSAYASKSYVDYAVLNTSRFSFVRAWYFDPDNPSEAMIVDGNQTYYRNPPSVSQLFTVPADVYWLYIIASGGGGGAGQGPWGGSSGARGGCGGGSGRLVALGIKVTPGQIISITIGRGGAAGPAMGTWGTPGEATIIAGVGWYIRIPGGGGGGGGDSAGAAGDAITTSGIQTISVPSGTVNPQSGSIPAGTCFFYVNDAARGGKAGTQGSIVLGNGTPPTPGENGGGVNGGQGGSSTHGGGLYGNEDGTGGGGGGGVSLGAHLGLSQLGGSGGDGKYDHNQGGSVGSQGKFGGGGGGGGGGDDDAIPWPSGKGGDGFVWLVYGEHIVSHNYVLRDA